MKYFLLLSICFSTYTFGQEIVFDTTHRQLHNKNYNYYEKVNLSVIDSLELWSFSFDPNYRGYVVDSIKSLGRLKFWRKVPIDDIVNDTLYRMGWTPKMDFDVYSIKDSSFVFNQSLKTKLSSSCMDLFVGGDIIWSNNFLFLNRDVCLDCIRFGQLTDYCRPIINYIFSKADRNNITTIESLVKQFPIEEKKLSKLKE